MPLRTYGFQLSFCLFFKVSWLTYRLCTPEWWYILEQENYSPQNYHTKLSFIVWRMSKNSWQRVLQKGYASFQQKCMCVLHGKTKCAILWSRGRRANTGRYSFFIPTIIYCCFLFPVEMSVIICTLDTCTPLWPLSSRLKCFTLPFILFPQWMECHLQDWLSQLRKQISQSYSWN